MKRFSLLLVLGALLFVPVAASEPSLGIATSAVWFQTDTGDIRNFTTTITNDGAVRSASLIAAMNIVNIGSGAPVDPEDWSPARAQRVEPLDPGESVTLNWTLFSILEGDYMVYVVAIPEPDGPKTSAVPVSGPGLHLSVRGVSQYNPAGILPLSLGIPAFAAIGSFSLRIWRRRNLDPIESQGAP